jgi:hypothetical protein
LWSVQVPICEGSWSLLQLTCRYQFQNLWKKDTCSRKECTATVRVSCKSRCHRSVLHLPGAGTARYQAENPWPLLRCLLQMRIRIKCWFGWKIMEDQIIQINRLADAPRTHTDTSDARVGFQRQSCCSAKTSCTSFRAGINAFQPIKTTPSLATNWRMAWNTLLDCSSSSQHLQDFETQN